MIIQNTTGFKTLIGKEVGRFLNVYLQTIIAPVVTTILFYIVFDVVFSAGRAEVFGLPFMTFLAPGLVMMAMAQNSFANTSSSLIVGKMQRSIDDMLMAPLSAFEIVSAYAIGALIRGMMIGVLAIALLYLFLNIPIYSIGLVLVFSILGCVMMALFGILGGLWADKFDHLAVLTNFIVTPLTFLSGTFFSIERLGEEWQVLATGNPFFYMIDGFRHGFLGVGDSNPYIGMSILAVCVALLFWAAYTMVKTGYKIKS